MVRSRESKAFQAVGHIVLIIMSLCVILPFILLLMSSLTEENALVRNGYSFFPETFSLASYEWIFSESGKIFKAYGITVFATVVGTTVNLLISSLLAYPLSIKNLPGRKGLTFYVFFTMLFNGGLVPTYIMYTNYLHIKNTIWAFIIPSLLMSAMNVLLIRTYISTSIPDALFEAASIDGASQLRIFFTIVLPLGKPILVTMGMFAGLGYWNDWTNGLYYITDEGLYSIQTLLNAMLTNVQVLSSSAMGNHGGAQLAQIPTVGVRMAIAVVAMIPILIIFPFLQKYFQKGIALGAVKG